MIANTTEIRLIRLNLAYLEQGMHQHKFCLYPAKVGTVSSLIWVIDKQELQEGDKVTFIDDSLIKYVRSLASEHIQYGVVDHINQDGYVFIHRR